uniref:Uncharacterized protein n=1 Tax=Picea glauca TaxID=3330 RepID=A0A117NIU4_PICGL|nr:hypothetical protein ABT39_MTgene265 [Picea glauca]
MGLSLFRKRRSSGCYTCYTSSCYTIVLGLVETRLRGEESTKKTMMKSLNRETGRIGGRISI